MIRNQHMGVRGWALMCALAAVGVGAIAIVWMTQHAVRDDGPLAATSSMGVEFALARGEVASWAVILPYNVTDDVLRIVEVEPRNVRGLDILGIVTTAPEDGTIVSAMGFPPDGMHARPVEGAAIRPRADAPEEFQILFGVRLVDESASGGIDVVRVRYEDSAGQQYDVMLPWTLKVTLASS